MSRRTLTLLLAGVLSLGLVLVVAVARVPYVALAPGPTYNTLGLDDQGHEVISVNGRPTYADGGHLNMTTISVVTPLTLAQALRGWFRHDYAVVTRDVIYPPDETADQVQKQDAADFRDSQASATTAALRYLGVPGVTHVLVAKVQKNAPATGLTMLNSAGKASRNAETRPSPVIAAPGATAGWCGRRRASAQRRFPRRAPRECG